MGNDNSDICPEEVLASHIAARRKLAIAENEVRAANYERQEQWSQAWQPLCCRDGEFLGKWDPSLIPSVYALAELIQAFGHSDVLDTIVQRMARWIERVKVPEEYESPAITFRGNESNQGFSGFMEGIFATAIVLSRAVKGELQIVPDDIPPQLLNAGSWGDLRHEIPNVPPDHPIDPILKRRKITCIRCGVTSEADAKRENPLFDICDNCNRIEGKLISVYLALAQGDPDRIAKWPLLRASLCKKFGYLADDLDLYKLLLDWLLNEKGIDDQAANNLSIDQVIEWLKSNPSNQATGTGSIEYPELLELRTLKQRLSVGCGRIWKDYKASKINEERLGRDWQIKIKEAFPIALLYRPSLTLKDFQHYSKEGTKPNHKVFRDWVHGSKGEKIPIEKFFA